jgi:hypothetical protein
MLVNRISVFIKGIFFLCLVSLLFSCRKDKVEANIKDVTGYKWNILCMEAKVPDLNTFYYAAVQPGGEFHLNSDQTFSMKLGDGEGSGTYTWTIKDSVHSIYSVNFSVKKSNESFANLKQLLEAVDTFYDSQYPDALEGFGRPAYTKILYFGGSEGGFYVYR